MCKIQTYELYYEGKLKKIGTKDELADYSGLSCSTIYSYASSTKRKKWEVCRHDPFIPFEAINLHILLDRMSHFDYSPSDISEQLDMSTYTFNSKLRGDVRFRESEITLMEDLLYCEEGTFVKDYLIVS